MGKKLGKGAYGIVWRGVHSELGSIVAVKELHLEGVSKDVRSSLQMEIDLLQALNHPNIVRYIEHIVSPDQKKLNIIMEFVENGSLAQMVKKKKFFFIFYYFFFFFCISLDFDFHFFFF